MTTRDLNEQDKKIVCIIENNRVRKIISYFRKIQPEMQWEIAGVRTEIENLKQDKIIKVKLV